jgi:pyrroline-5-carboxylate reductase
MKVTVIGAGNMGGALAKGWIRAGLANDLTVTAHTQATLDRLKDSCPGLSVSLSNREAVANADIIVLAVKPWIIDDVIEEIDNSAKGKVIISVAANVRNEAISVYAMPNIAAEFGESMTFIEESGNDTALKAALSLFQLVGKTKTVSRKQMEAGMMMSGCGIAYVMRYLRAMTEGGVEMGFRPDDSMQIAMQTMQGAITLLEETKIHPEAAIDKVTTPGGVTIKGLNELDHAGFNSAVIRSLKAGLK